MTAYLSRPMPQWLRAAFGGHILAREAFPAESYVDTETDKKQHEEKSKRAINSTVHVIAYTIKNGIWSILLSLLIALVAGGALPQKQYLNLIFWTGEQAEKHKRYRAINSGHSVSTSWASGSVVSGLIPEIMVRSFSWVQKKLNEIMRCVGSSSGKTPE